jgi:DNA-binding response OmpR family regulator
MKGRNILVVDDDKKIVANIRLYLEHAGFDVRVAYTGREALELCRQEQPDLVVLDLMLSQMSGDDVCRRLRAESEVPIIMLTAKTTEQDKLIGLGLGADDYVTKPFSPRELVARVRTILRRRANQVSESGPSQLRFGDLVIDIERHEVRVGNEPVHLTPNEFKLIEVLAQSPERAFTRQELVEKAFAWDYDSLDRTIDVHIKNLRRKLEATRYGSAQIKTVYGIGYKFSNAGAHS